MVMLIFSLPYQNIPKNAYTNIDKKVRFVYNLKKKGANA